MTTNDIRKAFLEFFEKNGHKVVDSAPLIPANDPTLLFTNAGMVPFKDCFLGTDKRSYTRATSSQRCVRAGGKHNDLENVGYTARHHTFFEMLGNFSFGDYSKKEAIHYCWELLTEVFKLPKEKLWVTVYAEDDEAYDIWAKDIGFPEDRISRIGDNKGERYASDNFWAMGDTGPCGPCSEVFYDHGEHIWGGPPGTPEEDGDRYIEIWNLVFMQYNRHKDGTMEPLPKPSVDTGMGLERISAILQGVHSNYEIDTFQYLIKQTADLLNVKDLDNKSLRVIADHIRSCCFLILDGIVPSNEGRGYVLRRIIRRAMRHGYQLGIRRSFFSQLVDGLGHVMGDAYPDLVEKQDHIKKIIFREEEKFLGMIDRGMRLIESATSQSVAAVNYAYDKFSAEKTGFEKSYDPPYSQLDGTIYKKVGKPIAVKALERDSLNLSFVTDAVHFLEDNEHFDSMILVILSEYSQSAISNDILRFVSASNAKIYFYTPRHKDLEMYRIIPGWLAFKLHDTYGFPVDLTTDVAREKGFSVDLDGYEKEMEAQRERARASSNFGVDYNDSLTLEEKSEFTGYDYLSQQVKVVKLLKDSEPVDSLKEGEKGIVVLEKTPFYAESGGQVGDKGYLYGCGANFIVEDTQNIGDAIAHLGYVDKGDITSDSELNANVDGGLRQSTMRNHSATHLLHAALRDVLGSHVQQKGSLNDPDRLRFDFSNPEAVSREDLATVERMVNEKIFENHSVEAAVMSMDEAKEHGAMALFGEKYGDEVRVLTMSPFSVELCGGTHVKRTGDIGPFKIVSETGIAAGVRRIEAITGEKAVAWMQQSESKFHNLGKLLKTDPAQSVEKVEQLLDKSKQLEKQIQQLQSKLASSQGSDLASNAEDVNGVKLLVAKLEGVEPKALRDMQDQLKNKLGSSIVVLAIAGDDKVSLIAGVSKDLISKVKAGDLIKMVAEQVGGKGGGRPDMAQAGGKDPAALPAALDSVKPWVLDKLA